MAPESGLSPAPSRIRLAYFLLLYLLAVPLTALAAERLAEWAWPRAAGLLRVEPWPGSALPESLGGNLGSNLGLFALRGVTNLGLTVIVTALFQRGLWGARRGLRHLGLGGKGAGAELARGLLLGASAMLLVYAILAAAGWATRPAPAAPADTPSGWGIPALLAGFACLAAQEELVARGFLLQNLAVAVGFPAAAVAQAVLFGAAHLANPHAGVASTAGIFAAGLFLAAAFAATGRLWLPTGAHLAWNLVEGPILGLPLSGVRTVRFLDTRLTGPAAATGGAFGPEAGWVAVAVLLAFTLWLGLRARRLSP